MGRGGTRSLSRVARRGTTWHEVARVARVEHTGCTRGREIGLLSVKTGPSVVGLFPAVWFGDCCDHSCRMDAWAISLTKSPRIDFRLMLLHEDMSKPTPSRLTHTHIYIYIYNILHLSPQHVQKRINMQFFEHERARPQSGLRLWCHPIAEWVHTVQHQEETSLKASSRTCRSWDVARRC